MFDKPRLYFHKIGCGTVQRNQILENVESEWKIMRAIVFYSGPVCAEDEYYFELKNNMNFNEEKDIL